MGEYAMGKISCCFLVSNSHCFWRLYPKALLGIDKWISFLGRLDVCEMDSSMWIQFMLIKWRFVICIQRYISRTSKIIRIKKDSLLRRRIWLPEIRSLVGGEKQKSKIPLPLLTVSLLSLPLWLTFQWSFQHLHCRMPGENLKSLCKMIETDS